MKLFCNVFLLNLGLLLIKKLRYSAVILLGLKYFKIDLCLIEKLSLVFFLLIIKLVLEWWIMFF